MSATLEQAIQSMDSATAALIAARQDLEGKNAAIDASVAAQQAAFTAWMNNAKNQFASNNYRQVFVGGANNKWYPVVFPLPIRVLGRLNIARHVHEDLGRYGTWNGSMALSVDAISSEWGGVPGRVIPYSYQYRLYEGFPNPPVADVVLDGHGRLLVVYLLGQRTYDISTSWTCTVDVHTADTGNKIFAHSTMPQYDIYKDAKTSIEASMIPNNYLRGG